MSDYLDGMTAGITLQSVSRISVTGGDTCGVGGSGYQLGYQKWHPLSSPAQYRTMSKISSSGSEYVSSPDS